VACTCSKKPEPAPQKNATPAAAPAPRETLRGVWGSSANDIWVVGNHGTILRYDGASWHDVPSGTELNLGGVTGSAADDVWAVGDHGVILHFDGKSWQLFDEGQEDRTFLSVFARSRQELWIAGIADDAGFVRRYQDQKLAETQAIPGCTGFWRMSPVAANDLWFVGADRRAKSFAMHHIDDHYEHRPIDAGPVRAVYGAASDDVWIGMYDGALHHWDGAKWQEAAPIDNVHWLGMWGTSKDDVWVYGHDGAIYHYDDKAWSRVDSHTQESIWSAWGSSANDVWFVGKSATLVHWDGQALTLKQ
jgi:hypothetical protein